MQLKIENLIEATELVESLASNKNNKLKILNCAFYLPHERKNPLAEHMENRIPGAKHFDIGHISHKGKHNPYMLPKLHNFTEYMTRLKIGKEDEVICYDYRGLNTAPRVWWTLKTFGFKNVKVLNGGFPKWASLGLPIQKGESDDPLPAPETEDTKEKYKFEHNRLLISNYQEIRDHIFFVTRGICQGFTIDARPTSRYEGTEEDPIKAERRGHIETAINIPVSAVLNSDKITMKNPKELYFMFNDYKLDLTKPIVAYCATGIYACTTILGLIEAGGEKVSLYDGGWLEYVIYFSLIEIGNKTAHKNAWG